MVQGGAPVRLPAPSATRWVIRKQHLSAEGRAADLVGVATDLIGLHATDPLTPYLSLLARVPGFAAEMLDRELFGTHELVRVPAMRNTLFLVARPLLPTVLAATGPAGVRSSWRFFAQRLTPEQYRDAVPRVTEALRGRQLTVPELRRSLRLDIDIPAVVKLMCDEHLLIRARPAGGWRSSQHAYALMADWLPGLDFPLPGEAQALTALVRAYVGAYGPVTEADIAWWTGAPKRSIRASLAGLSTEMASIELEGFEQRAVMLRADLDELLVGPALPPAGLRLLPQLDPYTQGYADRRRYLDAQHSRFVVDRKGNTTSTILLDGRVAGVWDIGDVPAEVRIYLLAGLDDEQRRELSRLTGNAARLVTGNSLPATEYTTMVPLTKRPGWVRSPLDHASGARPLTA